MVNDVEVRTGAQVRGAIQKEGDGLRPEFDPAAAPYESDAERRPVFGHGYHGQRSPDHEG
jgi:hypothetical protein